MIDSTSSGRTSQKSTHTVSPKIKIKKKRRKKKKKSKPCRNRKKKKKGSKEPNGEKRREYFGPILVGQNNITKGPGALNSHKIQVNARFSQPHPSAFHLVGRKVESQPCWE